MLCDPDLLQNSSIETIKAVFSLEVAKKLADTTQIEAVEFGLSTLKCPDKRVGFHSVLSINDTHGVCHVHWETEREAMDFTYATWEAVIEITQLWGLNPSTGLISYN